MVIVPGRNSVDIHVVSADLGSYPNHVMVSVQGLCPKTPGVVKSFPILLSLPLDI